MSFNKSQNFTVWYKLQPLIKMILKVQLCLVTLTFALPGAWEDTPLERPSSAPVQDGERDSAKGKFKRRVTVGPTQDITDRPWSPSAIMYACFFNHLYRRYHDSRLGFNVWHISINFNILWFIHMTIFAFCSVTKDTLMTTSLHRTLTGNQTVPLVVVFRCWRIRFLKIPLWNHLYQSLRYCILI